MGTLRLLWCLGWRRALGRRQQVKAREHDLAIARREEDLVLRVVADELTVDSDGVIASGAMRLCTRTTSITDACEA